MSAFAEDVQADYFFASNAHETAYGDLLEGVRTHEGCILLTGDAGSGKTLLLRRLIHAAPAALKCVYCPGDGLDFDQLLGFICDELRLPLHRPDRPARLKAIHHHIDACAEARTAVALLLDNAHNMSENLLNHLLILGKGSSGHDKRALRLVFCGLPILTTRVDKYYSHPVRRSSPLCIYLDGLSCRETGLFLRTCQMPQTDRKTKETRHQFSQSEINRIFKQSGGNPGIILALNSGHNYAPGDTQEQVSPERFTAVQKRRSKQQQSSEKNTLSSQTTHGRKKYTAPISTAPVTGRLKYICRSTPAIAALSLMVVLVPGLLTLSYYSPEQSVPAVADPVKPGVISLASSHYRAALIIPDADTHKSHRATGPAASDRQSASRQITRFFEPVDVIATSQANSSVPGTTQSASRDLPSADLTPAELTLETQSASLLKSKSSAMIDAEAELIPARAAELQLWNMTQQRDTTAAYKLYLNAYPEGIFAVIASSRLQQAPQQTIQRYRETNSTAILLKKARQALDAKALTTPANDNAAKWAKATLRLDPDNAEARDLLSHIIDQYLYWTAQNIERGKLPNARRSLAKAQTLNRYASTMQSAATAVLNDEIRTHQRQVTRSKSNKKRPRKSTRIVQTESNENASSWLGSVDSRMQQFGWRMTQRFAKNASVDNSATGFNSAR